MIQIKRTTVNTSWYGWDEARVRLSCDEIVFSSVMRVKFHPSPNHFTYKGL